MIIKKLVVIFGAITKGPHSINKAGFHRMTKFGWFGPSQEEDYMTPRLGLAHLYNQGPGAPKPKVGAPSYNMLNRCRKPYAIRSHNVASNDRH